MIALTVPELTTANPTSGTGIFDTLMRAMAAHLELEFTKGRIKGPEYSTVYLGSLEPILRTSLQFMLERQKEDLLEAQQALVEAQAALINKQILLADQEILVKQQQVLVSIAEVGIAQAKLVNIPKEGLQLDAQTALVTQQKVNLTAEKLSTEAKTLMITQQKANLLLEADNIPKQGLVLTGQKCKLDAEYDILLLQKLNTATENALLTQKILTEKAQTTSLGVDADSVVGRQKALYAAQTAGFTRDAEQKVAKTLIDTWNVRRTTDEGTLADTTNKLDDATIGRAVTKLLAGVGA